MKSNIREISGPKMALHASLIQNTQSEPRRNSEYLVVSQSFFGLVVCLIYLAFLQDQVVFVTDGRRNGHNQSAVPSGSETEHYRYK